MKITKSIATEIKAMGETDKLISRRGLTPKKDALIKRKGKEIINSNTEAKSWISL